MTKFKTLALTTCAVAALATGAVAQERAKFEIAGGDLKAALQTFAGQTTQEVLFSTDVVSGLRTKGVSAETDPQTALVALLEGTGLTYTRTPTGTLLIVRAAQDPQSGSAAGDGADGTVEALIVTAQKREEDIQDVPIAISAFTQEALEAQKIEGGFDLLKAIPNVTFSKNNFTSYNFSIRGVGTKAVSATTDPGVSVSFNNTGVIQNRLFEQEYFDVERVEVLRGPQGTLYGRNATSGVINVITAKPDLNDFNGWLKGEVGNYDAKRISAMVNVPLIDDKLAVRLAGAMTDRQGYDFNSVTKNAVNGRDLRSARLTIGFEPLENLRGELIWERFNEDDNRSRTGKQLCHRDPGPAQVGDFVLAEGSFDDDPEYAARQLASRQAIFSQGCSPGSLFEDQAFGTPNGLAYPFILGLVADVAPTIIGSNGERIIERRDPYAGLMQSRNLREIASVRDPVYRASADLFQLNIDFDVTPSLTLSSQTAYVEDETYSFQDFNRFNSVPIFTDTSQIEPANGDYSALAPGGIFCDPQIGCSDTIAGFDIAQGAGTQFSQEFRLQSSFDGPINFSAGANYTEFETLIDYYVMFNVLTATAWSAPFNMPSNIPPYDGGRPLNTNLCHGNKYVTFGFDDFAAVPVTDPFAICPYVDPNALDTSKNFEGEGHNYFRSKNPYELKSWALFGETYWNIRDDLKITAGLRYTDDKKIFTPVPSQLLLAPGLVGGGTTAIGYPEDPVIEQKWGEWTGRLVLDWKPDLDFTEETLLYASYSHGYKGGGANPPRPGFATRDEIIAIAQSQGTPQFLIDLLDSFGMFPILAIPEAEYGQTFDPEFVDAFEVGAKNTLLGGAMSLNLTGFYYDYKDYQVSQIRDRTAVNENFDATVWGFEIESLFAPSPNLQIVANLGYLDTQIADGERSIDIMNRTQGNPDYIVAKPWIQLPSNCIVPTAVAEAFLVPITEIEETGTYQHLCGVGGILGFVGGPPIDPKTGQPWDPNATDADGNLIYPEINGGAGIFAELGGNELPNAPHWTANVGAQYGVDILEGWRATIRGDVYWQSQSYHRVYNYEPYDKLHGWWNANLSVWFERPEDGLKIELYAKNIFNDTPITDAFLNSDDTALTTNVFVLDPRLIGLSIRKEF